LVKHSLSGLPNLVSPGFRTKRIDELLYVRTCLEG
jgi:hypothetical protein